jgi:hypothetical protein
MKDRKPGLFVNKFWSVSMLLDPDPDRITNMDRIKDSQMNADPDPQHCLTTSVADLECLSRIPDRDFYPSRIPDPKAAAKERGEKKFVVIPFFVATNFT